MYRSENAEGNGSRDNDYGLVDTKSDLLRGSEQEVLELGSIQDEKDHGKGNSNDLDYKEYHDAL